MQRDRRKLADVLDGAVPGQTIVHIRHHAQVYAVDARLLEDILHDSALARGGKEDFIHKLLADMLEKRIQRSDHIAGTGRQPRSCPGKLDESLERVTEMT